MKSVILLICVVLLALCPCILEGQADDHEHDCKTHPQDQLSVGLCCGDCCENARMCRSHMDAHMDDQETLPQPLRESVSLPIFSALSRFCPSEKQDELSRFGLLDLTGIVVLRC
ncbi:MAG TPA: hypothetical protein PKH07_06435 [bacterium]|nr:hypothetical protein [bacterium]